MDIETFFDRIRQNLIDLMNRELTNLGLARVQTAAWIRLMVEVDNESGNVIGVSRVAKAFNSQKTKIFQGSDFNEIANEMLPRMKTQIKTPALINYRFKFDEILFLDGNFYQLSLTQGSFYLPLPDWIMKKKAVINPENENDKECFKLVVNAALHYVKSHPERISNLRNRLIITIGLY